MFNAHAKTKANFNFKYPEPTAGAKVSSLLPMPKLIIDAPQILKTSSRNIGRSTISRPIFESCSIIYKSSVLQGWKRKMSLKGSLSDRDSKTKALELFKEHRNKVKECIVNLEEVFKALYEKGDCTTPCARLVKNEAEADRLKEQLIELLFKGAFLPLTGEDRLKIIEMNDNVADAAEKTIRALKAYLPWLWDIDQNLKKEIWQLSHKVTELSEHLAKSMELLADDFKSAFQEAENVEKMRRDVRNKGYELVELLFKQKNSDMGATLLVKEIILDIMNVADVAEDASDFITAIVVKYAY